MEDRGTAFTLLPTSTLNVILCYKNGFCDTETDEFSFHVTYI